MDKISPFKHTDIKTRRGEISFISGLFTCVEPEPKLVWIASNWALYNRAFRSAPVNRSVFAAKS